MLRSDSENSMSADFSVCCSLCGKEFPSMKSLFAHIKCHPERDWRPPPCPSNSSSNLSEEDDMVFHSTEIMPQWPVIEDEDDNDDEEEMRLRNCVSGLMLLKHITDGSDSSGLSTQHHVNGGDQHHEEVTNNKEEEFDDLRLVGNGNFVPIPVPVMIDESSDHVMQDFIGTVGQEGNVAAAHHGVEISHRHVEVESHGINTELVLGSVGDQRLHFDGINDKEDNHGGKFVMGNSKNNKMMKMKMGLYQDRPSGTVGSSVQVPGASTSTDKYKCSTCDKTFSTHQALGGHRSSHNKFKVTIINGDSCTKKSVSAFAPPVQIVDCATKRKSIDEIGGSSKAVDISSSVHHQCSVCNKIFASGQALGGHKRSHWTAPAAEAQPEPQLELQLAVRSSGEEAGTQAGGKRIRLMGFDLNVPASMVDNAAQDGGASW
ncbi:hypothetical protein POM88_046912 [Heracleum sosnowskyi]|uniref:C2H2-type domain-containing protein n=1 Tax=Heracleum sosnowskyi TaxID=360622 RepID=A0AAD8H9J5_9APIA|nr:hypothetical protein POM88_046912 [Heracleum sosnowskyi]